MSSTLAERDARRQRSHYNALLVAPAVVLAMMALFDPLIVGAGDRLILFLIAASVITLAVKAWENPDMIR